MMTFDKRYGMVMLDVKNTLVLANQSQLKGTSDKLEASRYLAGQSPIQKDSKADNWPMLYVINPGVPSGFRIRTFLLAHNVRWRTWVPVKAIMIGFEVMVVVKNGRPEVVEKK